LYEVQHADNTTVFKIWSDVKLRQIPISLVSSDDNNYCRDHLRVKVKSHAQDVSLWHKRRRLYHSSIALSMTVCCSPYHTSISPC